MPLARKCLNANDQKCCFTLRCGPMSLQISPFRCLYCNNVSDSLLSYDLQPGWRGGRGKWLPRECGRPGKNNLGRSSLIVNMVWFETPKLIPWSRARGQLLVHWDNGIRYHKKTQWLTWIHKMTASIGLRLNNYRLMTSELYIWMGSKYFCGAKQKNIKQLGDDQQGVWWNKLKKL